MAEPILTPWVLSLSVVYVLYIQWIGHFLLKNCSQCIYPLAFRLWTYSTVNYLMKLRDIQLPSLSTYSGDIFEPTSATLACMHASFATQLRCRFSVMSSFRRHAVSFFNDVISLPCSACISLLVVRMSHSQMAQYVYGKMSSQITYNFRTSNLPSS